MDMQDTPGEPTLPEPATGHDAVRYVRSLVWWIGPGFHPDNDFHEYINVNTDELLFSPSQADRLNKEFGRAAEILDAAGVDVCAVAFPVQYRMLRGVPRTVPPG